MERVNSKYSVNTKKSQRGSLFLTKKLTSRQVSEAQSGSRVQALAGQFDGSGLTPMVGFT